MCDKNDIEFVKTIIHAFTPLLKGYEESREILVLKNITELVKMCDKNDIEFIKTIIQSFTPLLNCYRESIKILAFEKIAEFVEMCDKDNELVKFIIDKFTLILKGFRDSLKIPALKKITEFVKMCDENDIEFVKTITRTIMGSVGGSDNTDLNTALICCKDLTKICGSNDLELLQEFVINSRYVYQWQDMQDLKSDILRNLINLSDVELVDKIIIFLKPPQDYDDIFMMYILELIKIGDQNEIGPSQEIIEAFFSHLQVNKRFEELFDLFGRWKNQFFKGILKIYITVSKSESEFDHGVLTGLVRICPIETLRDFIEALIFLIRHDGSNAESLGFKNLTSYFLINSFDSQFQKGLIKACILYIEDSDEKVKSFVFKVIANLVISTSHKIDADFEKEMRQIFTKFLQDPDLIIKHHATKIILYLAFCENDDIEIVKNCIKTINLFLKNSSDNMSADHHDHVRIFKWITEQLNQYDLIDVEIIQELIDGVTSVQKFGETDLNDMLQQNVEKLVEKCGNSAIELVQNSIKQFIPLLQHSQGDERRLIFANISVLPSISRFKDSLLLTEIIKIIAPLLRDSNNLLGEKELSHIKQIMTNSESMLPAIEILTPLLQDLDNNVVRRALFVIRYARMRKNEENNPQLVQQMNEIIIPLLQHPDSSIREVILKIIGEQIQMFGNNGTQFVREITKASIPFLNDSDMSVRESAFYLIEKLMKICDKNDIQLFREIIKGLIQFFINSEDSLNFQELAVSSIEELMKICDNDMQLIQEIIQTLVPFLRDSDSSVKRSAIDLSHRYGIIDICNNDIQLVQEMIKTLTSLLHDSDSKIRDWTLNEIYWFMKKCKNNDIPFPQEIIKGLTPFLSESESHFAFSLIKEFVRISDNETQVVQEIIQTLGSFLRDSNSIAREFALDSIKELMEICDKTNIQLVQETIKTLTPLLRDSEWETRNLILEFINELMEICENDTQFLQEIIQTLASYLCDSDSSVRESVLYSIENLIEICAKNDIQLSQEIIKAFIPLIQDSQSEIKKSAFKFLKKHMVCGCDDAQPLREAIKKLIPSLQDSDIDVRYSALDSITKLAEICGNCGNQLVKACIPLLQDSEWRISDLTFNFIRKQRTICGYDYAQPLTEAIKKLTPSLQDSDRNVRSSALKKIQQLAKIFRKSDAQLAQEVLRKLIPFLQDLDTDLQFSALDSIGMLIEICDLLDEFRETFVLLSQDPDRNISFCGKICLANLAIICGSSDIQFVKDIMKILMPLLQDKDVKMREIVWNQINKIVKNSGGTQLVKEFLEDSHSLLKSNDRDIKWESREYILKLVEESGDQAIQLVREVIESLISKLQQERHGRPDYTCIINLLQIFGHINTQVVKEAIETVILALQKDGIHEYDFQELKLLAVCFKNSDTKLVREMIEIFIPVLDDPKDSFRESACTSISELVKICGKRDTQHEKEIIKALTPYLQHSDLRIADSFSKTIRSVFLSLLTVPDQIAEYFQHPSKNIRDIVKSSLLIHLTNYVHNFQSLNEILQIPHELRKLRPLDWNLVKNNYLSNPLSDNLKSKIETLRKKKDKYRKLKLLLASEIDHIKTLKGPQIIEFALAIIGRKAVSDKDSESKKLIELAREVLDIQLKYLDNKKLRWLNANQEKLLSLSPETKLFNKKIYHKLLEDKQITLLEEELIIKFINQGLTTSLTRNGEMIFESKRYKLSGGNIELTLERIAKTIIEQKQDILATQYKQNEPIFKKSFQGGMKEAAVDKKEVKSAVDSRFTLGNDFWVLSRLKSLKFKSEIIILEQRSAFGDHIICCLTGEQKIFRQYPVAILEGAVRKEIFGSYIYGEVYQGELVKLPDKIGQRMFENKDKEFPENEENQVLEKDMIYFQQELLNEGRGEDRNSSIEKQLSEKINDNRKALKRNLESLGLQDSQQFLIEQYYEGFLSTFSSVYTSSQAIDSGKLSIDDGEDFFSPVNLFIKLTSLAPFGIGQILSGGLEAARSHIKSTKIANQAKYVKDLASDAVELNILVGDIAFKILSKEEQRRKIFEAKAEEKPNNVINKVKDVILQKLAKLKKLAEKYTQMKNLFEKEIEKSPAFQLGENDANQLISEWIERKESEHMNQKEKARQEKANLFAQAIISDDGKNKPAGKDGAALRSKTSTAVVSPEITPLEEKGKFKSTNKNKTACCEIF